MSSKSCHGDWLNKQCVPETYKHLGIAPFIFHSIDEDAIIMQIHF